MTVNILFHGVGVPRRPLEPGEEQYFVSVDAFARILDDLTTWPDVRISFDDGNSSDLDLALPALRERGLRAEFFILAGRLEQAGCVDGDGVRELARQGMTIGSHGMRHLPWRHLSAHDIEEEFVRARDRLSEVVGAPVETAACPFGAYDRRTLSSLRHQKYARVYTSDRRSARSEAWLQARYSVQAGDTPATLRAAALSRPPVMRQARAAAIGLVKRLR